MVELKPGSQTLDSIFLTPTLQSDGCENHTARLGSVPTLSPCHRLLLLLLLLSLPQISYEAISAVTPMFI